MHELPDIVRAPWAPSTVAALNRYQAEAPAPVYLCGRRAEHPDDRGLLIATMRGWACPACSFKQRWVRRVTLTWFDDQDRDGPPSPPAA